MTINGHTTDLSAELEELRMSRDWTYLQLANAIETVTHRRRAEDCWRRICQGQTTQPHGRTLAILEAFLATVRGSARRRTNGRRATRRATA
jgi:hypothetical protein